MYRILLKFGLHFIRCCILAWSIFPIYGDVWYSRLYLSLNSLFIGDLQVEYECAVQCAVVNGLLLCICEARGAR